MFAPRSATNARAIDSVGLKTRLINAYIPHNLVFYQRVSPSYTRLGSSQRSIVPSQVSRRLDGWRGWAHLTPVSPITHPHQPRLTPPPAAPLPPRRLSSRPPAPAPCPRAVSRPPAPPRHFLGDRLLIVPSTLPQATNHAVAIPGRLVLTELALALDRLDLKRKRNNVRQQAGNVILRRQPKRPRIR